MYWTLGFRNWCALLWVIMFCRTIEPSSVAATEVPTNPRLGSIVRRVKGGSISINNCVGWLGWVWEAEAGFCGCINQMLLRYFVRTVWAQIVWTIASARLFGFLWTKLKKNDTASKIKRFTHLFFLLVYAYACRQMHRHV